MKRRCCICQSITGLERLIAEGNEITWLTHDDGTQATMQEICAAIVEAKAKGYDVLPPCNNVNETGHCMGHDVGTDEDLPAIKVSAAITMEYGQELNKYGVIR